MGNDGITEKRMSASWGHDAGKKKIDAEAVPVTLYLNKIVSQSKSSIVKGYLRSAIVNDPTFFEVSETPQGENPVYQRRY